MKEKLENLAVKISVLKNKDVSEEPTKMSLIVPFLQILDYDVFNLDEVEPEFTADFGTKKGEKVDYAIFKNGEPKILIECKPINEKLNIHNSQLFRYYSTTTAKYAILTNGEIYEFYTDIDKSNIMDSKPFMVINLSNLLDDDVNQLSKFHKDFFNERKIYDSATNLKYINEIKELILKDLENPSEDFIKYYTNKLYNGKNTEKVINTFSNYIKTAFKNVINIDFDKKIKKIVNDSKENEDNNEENKSKIETTDFELDSFFTIKSILRDKYSNYIDKLGYRDTINYLNVYVNGPKNTLVRLYLNGINKYMTFLKDGKETDKLYINNIDDYYKYKEILEESFKQKIS